MKIDLFVDEKQIWPNEHFLNYLIEKRGVAVIKRVSDESEIARINLGKPLWFLNYVSFSYNGRYVAIAGRYPDNTQNDKRQVVYYIHQRLRVCCQACNIFLYKNLDWHLQTLFHLD